MNMNINEKKALYAFGCPVRKATVERLRMLAALTPTLPPRSCSTRWQSSCLLIGRTSGIAVSTTISAWRWRTTSMPSSL